MGLVVALSRDMGQSRRRRRNATTARPAMPIRPSPHSGARPARGDGEAAGVPRAVRRLSTLASVCLRAAFSPSRRSSRPASYLPSDGRGHASDGAPRSPPFERSADGRPEGPYRRPVGVATAELEARTLTVLGGTYRLERFIARGGMGAVYEAVHLRVPTDRCPRRGAS
jgi:hypothetical protein